MIRRPEPAQAAARSPGTRGGVRPPAGGGARLDRQAPSSLRPGLQHVDHDDFQILAGEDGPRRSKSAARRWASLIQSPDRDRLVHVFHLHFAPASRWKDYDLWAIGVVIGIGV